VESGPPHGRVAEVTPVAHSRVSLDNKPTRRHNGHESCQSPRFTHLCRAPWRPSSLATAAPIGLALAATGGRARTVSRPDTPEGGSSAHPRTVLTRGHRRQLGCFFRPGRLNGVSRTRPRVSLVLVPTMGNHRSAGALPAGAVGARASGGGRCFGAGTDSVNDDSLPVVSPGPSPEDKSSSPGASPVSGTFITGLRFSTWTPRRTHRYMPRTARGKRRPQACLLACVRAAPLIRGGRDGSPDLTPPRSARH